MSSFILLFVVVYDAVVGSNVFPYIMTSPRCLHVATVIEPTFHVSRPAPNEGQGLRPRQFPILAGAITKILDDSYIFIPLPSVIEFQDLVQTSLAFLPNINLIPLIPFDLLFT